MGKAKNHIQDLFNHLEIIAEDAKNDEATAEKLAVLCFGLHAEDSNSNNVGCAVGNRDLVIISVAQVLELNPHVREIFELAYLSYIGDTTRDENGEPIEYGSATKRMQEMIEKLNGKK